jgi:hypothetical protein
MRIGSPGNFEFYSESAYFCGIAPAPDALVGALGAAIAGSEMAPLAAPGIAAAPDALAAGAEAPDTGRSRMLPLAALGRSFAL